MAPTLHLQHWATFGRKLRLQGKMALPLTSDRAVTLHGEPVQPCRRVQPWHCLAAGCETQARPPTTTVDRRQSDLRRPSTTLVHCCPTSPRNARREQAHTIMHGRAGTSSPERQHACSRAPLAGRLQLQAGVAAWYCQLQLIPNAHGKQSRCRQSR